MVIFHSYVSLPEGNSPVINPPPPPSRSPSPRPGFPPLPRAPEALCGALGAGDAERHGDTGGPRGRQLEVVIHQLMVYPTIYENGPSWWGDFCIKHGKKHAGIYSVFKVV